MYKVIHFFTDLQDFNHPYNVGDIFPRTGLKVSEERFKELSCENNKQHKVLIKEVNLEQGEKEKKEINVEESQSAKKEEGNLETRTQYKKSDILSMNKAGLQNLAEKLGIEYAYNTSATGLKAKIIDHYGL